MMLEICVIVNNLTFFSDKNWFNLPTSFRKQPLLNKFMHEMEIMQRTFYGKNYDYENSSKLIKVKKTSIIFEFIMVPALKLVLPFVFMPLGIL